MEMLLSIREVDDAVAVNGRRDLYAAFGASGVVFF
jgi:hypothetical protein